MEKELCRAASVGDIHTMRKVLSDDNLILDEILSGSFKTNPLHVAILRNQAEFVKALLGINPYLAEVLESGRSPLHMAAAKGHVEIAMALVEASKKMCFARDPHGMNPVHVAAMEGNEEVLNVLIRACPQAARVKLDQNETILHLCVKHGQLGTLRLLLEMGVVPELVNATDSCGNTILHMAVSSQVSDIVDHVVNYGKDSANAHSKRPEPKLNLNAVNAQGHTALDIALFLGNKRYRDCLLQAECRRSEDSAELNWLLGRKETLMVVASLIATMAFQASVSPPSGVWQDDSNGHRAGEAVMAYKYPNSFPYFLRVNTVAFAASLSSIFLLLISDVPSKNRFSRWLLVLITWLTITSTAITYGFSITVITPKNDRVSLSNTLVGGVIAWCSMMALLLVHHTYKVIKEACNYHKTKTKMFSFEPSDQHAESRVHDIPGTP